PDPFAVSHRARGPAPVKRKGVVMLVDMRVPGFDLAGAFRRHLEKRVRVVFDSSARDVHAVTITFSDVNGPRGGVDLQCAVEVAFSSGAHVRAEARDHD